MGVVGRSSRYHAGRRRPVERSKNATRGAGVLDGDGVAKGVLDRLDGGDAVAAGISRTIMGAAPQKARGWQCRGDVLVVHVAELVEQREHVEVDVLEGLHLDRGPLLVAAACR